MVYIYHGISWYFVVYILVYHGIYYGIIYGIYYGILMYTAIMP